MHARFTTMLVRAIARWYPDEFRAPFAYEIETSTRALVDDARRRGAWSAISMSARAILDVVRSVLAERARAARTTSGGRGGGAAHDLRDAARQISRNPGFAAAAIVTLTLAVGGVTAVFSIADPLLFRALPYRDADRIVVLHAGSERAPLELFSADYAQLLQDRGPFEAIAQASIDRLGLFGTDADAFEMVALGGVTPEFFNVFGVQPRIGRAFGPSDYGGPRVAIITHALWTSAYRQRPDIVGQKLSLTGSRPVTYEIVGVMPADFVFPDFRDQVPVALTPVDIEWGQVRNPGYHSMPFARLRAGASHEEARATLQRAMTEAEKLGAGFAAARRWPVVLPLRDALYETVRAPMLMLLAVTCFVLVLASANLAHLFLARAAGRAAELATRQALGASPARLVRLLVIEASLIAAAGAAGALLFARVARSAALGMLPDYAIAVRGATGAFDLRIFALCAAASMLSLFVFGALPAFGAVRRSLRPAMTSSAHRAGRLQRNTLVLAQTGIAVAVVLTGLLLAASFMRLATQDLGFNPFGVQQAELTSPTNVNRDYARTRQLNLHMKALLDRLAPGPVAVTLGLPSQSLPTSLGRLDQERRRYPATGYPVSAEFFEVFELRLTRGRLYTREEGVSGAPVAVIDERAASLLWPGMDPLGREVRDSSGAVRSVIGVVAPLKTHVFSSRFQRAAAFMPIPLEHRRTFSFVWRGGDDPALASRIRRAVREFDGSVNAIVGPFDVVDQQLMQPRFLATLLGALAALAIALTVVGLYGVVSHGVAQRTREMGIRIALGAETSRIARLIVLQALRPAAIGVGLGLAASLWWTETLRSLLYGFAPHDWRVFASAGVIVLALVALACLLPIKRATRVDPLIALKTE